MSVRLGGGGAPVPCPVKLTVAGPPEVEKVAAPVKEPGAVGEKVAWYAKTWLGPTATGRVTGFAVQLPPKNWPLVKRLKPPIANGAVGPLTPVTTPEPAQPAPKHRLTLVVGHWTVELDPTAVSGKAIVATCAAPGSTRARSNTQARVPAATTARIESLPRSMNLLRENSLFRQPREDTPRRPPSRLGAPVAWHADGANMNSPSAR